ncbi:MAG: FAD-dependent oxidoreductase, partial [Anaerolineae bacterium]|nr:FAD-dependent oxidoreductase [Anaerolineae bacterium]
MSDSVLVIGGGIAGIQASLDLAEAGARVTIVEKQPTIGGIMAVLDKNFPTLDCSICIEAPKMSEVDLHPNIEIINLAQVERVTGEPGNFQVTIRQQSGFVTDECTRCDLCTEVCPEVTPNEYDSGMAFRKAIYTPIPQSAPGAYVIDIDRCLNDPPNYIPCNHCTEVCLPDCIDFMMPREVVHTREVGSVIVAVGYDTFDPHLMKEYGYGTHPDILTAMEYERLVNSAGPTEGEIIKPSNGEHPESILFVLCVGSRDQRHAPYCSRFCCMYSIKHAYQALDHGMDDVTVMYMDVRAYGKGFDGFWERTTDEGAKFVRGRPSRIQSGLNGNIKVTYEDTKQGSRVEQDFDMVVLATAALPSDGLSQLAENLEISVDADGFLQTKEIEGGLVVTTRPGIYAAGCSTGPKDIPDSVAEGSGAAALALGHLTKRHWPEPLEVEPVEDVDTPKVGVFVCHCGSNIAGVVDVPRVVEYSKGLDGVVFASNQMFSCAGNTQKELEDTIKAEGINRVVVAACSPKTHQSIFRGVMERCGLNPYLLEMSNIRNMDSWVHKFDKEAATLKAMDMVWMAVEKARRLVPLEASELPLKQSALVVGGGIAGMTASAALARQGFETHLVESSDRFGGMLNELDDVAPSNLKAKDLVEAKIKDMQMSGVQPHLKSEVETIGGVVGDFHATLSGGEELNVGAVVMATGSLAYAPDEFEYGKNPKVITNMDLDRMLENGGVDAETITFVSCIGSR